MSEDEVKPQSGEPVPEAVVKDEVKQKEKAVKDSGDKEEKSDKENAIEEKSDKEEENSDKEEEDVKEEDAEEEMEVEEKKADKVKEAVKPKKEVAKPKKKVAPVVVKEEQTPETPEKTPGTPGTTPGTPGMTPGTPGTPGVPLYDQPLELSGKRDRRKVERFIQEEKKEELKFEGHGTALGEIPFIEAMLTTTGPEDLKTLHRVAYNRPGSGFEIRRNLMKFNGFSYDKEDKLFKNKSLCTERITLPEIKRMLAILGLERSGVKTELVDRLMEFMLKPEDMGKKTPIAVTKKLRVKGKGNRGRPKKSEEKAKKNASTESGSDGDSSISSSNSDEEDKDEEDKDEDDKDEDDKDEDDKDEDDKEEDDEETKPKKAKKTPAKTKKTPAKKTPAKKKPAKRPASAKKTAKAKKPVADDSDSESDDEPLAKKVKQPPTDGEIKAMVKKILEGANLEEVTMKSVCRQVYDSYPDFDLAHKKDYIKETVKSIIS